MQDLTLRSTIALALTAAACSSAPQVDMEAELASLRAAADEYHSVLTAKDAEGLAAFYTADASFFPPCGAQIDGIAGIRAFLDEFMSAPGLAFMVTTVEVEVSASGDMGYAVVNADASMDDPDGATLEEDVRDVHVWRKIDGAWKVAVDVWNSENPLPCPEM